MQNIQEIEMFARVLLAAFLGGLVGVQREARGKAAGLRTNTLITSGAAVFAVLSIRIVPQMQGDPSRLAAAVITGIGFLGAGAIMRNEHDVLGLTTAATIWVNSGIGLCAGAGLYWTAIGTTALTLFILEVLPHLENRLGVHRFTTLRGENGTRNGRRQDETGETKEEIVEQ
jgi:putative Mg2+ transporter-C (MgtC) family protein